MKNVALLCVLCLLQLSTQSVQQVNDDNFAVKIRQSPLSIVAFVDSTEHSIQFAEQFSKASELAEQQDLRWSFFDLNVVANAETAKVQGVHLFPSYKLFIQGRQVGARSGRGKSASEIVEYLLEKNVSPTDRVQILTTPTFESVTTTYDVALVEFYAPWCGHCKQLAPEFEKAAKEFTSVSSVLFAKVDATEETRLGTEFAIASYPRIKLFVNGVYREDYDGDRDADSLVKYVNSQLHQQAPKHDQNWRAQLGRHTWFLLHSIAVKLPETHDEDLRSHVEKFFNALTHVYPCEKCRKNLKEHLASVGPVPSGGRDAISVWVCELHNVVNAGVGARTVPCDSAELLKEYMKSCGGCLTDEGDGLEFPVSLPSADDKVSQQSHYQQDGSCEDELLPKEWIQGHSSLVEGRVTVLFFWSYTCHVCHELIGQLDAMYKQYKDRGMNFIAVHSNIYGGPISDSQHSEFLDFLAREKPSFPVVTSEPALEHSVYMKHVGKFHGIPSALVLHNCQKAWQGFGFQVRSLPDFFAGAGERFLLPADPNAKIVEQKYTKKLNPSSTQTPPTWKETVGRSTWFLLHSIGAKFPDQPTKEQETAAQAVVTGLRALYPCSSCRDHIPAALALAGAMQTDSRGSLSMWVCGLHNAVNSALDKPLESCELRHLDKLYRRRCDDCLETEGEGQSFPLPMDSPAITPPAPAPERHVSSQTGSCEAKLVVRDWVIDSAGQRPGLLDGSVTVLYFFGVRCKLCLEVVPALQSLYTRYRHRGINLIGLHSDVLGAIHDDHPDLIKKEFDRLGANFPVATAESAAEDSTYQFVAAKFHGLPGLVVLHNCEKVWEGFGFKVRDLPEFFESPTGQRLLDSAEPTDRHAESTQTHPAPTGVTTASLPKKQAEEMKPLPGAVVGGGMQTGDCDAQLGVYKWLQGLSTMTTGKVTVLFFWSYTCHVCHELLHDLDKLYNRYKDQGLNLIGVHSDIKGQHVTMSQMSDLMDFVAKEAPSFPIVLSESSHPEHAYVKHVGTFHGVPGALVLKNCNKAWQGFGYQVRNLPAYFESGDGRRLLD